MSTQIDTVFSDYIHQGYLFSSDKEKVQANIVFQFLDKESYWAKGIPYDTVKRAIQFSICIGIYDETGIQVGFAA